MLEDRGTRKGIEVFVKSELDPNIPSRKARVVRTYSHPDRWLVVKYEDGILNKWEKAKLQQCLKQAKEKI